MTGATPGNQTQYSALTGQWTYSLTFTAKDKCLQQLITECHSMVNVLSEPQFQWTPPTSVTPAQYAVQAHVINVQWPQIGPFVFQSMIDAQWSITSGKSGVTTLVPGLQISLKQFDSVSFSAAWQLGLDHNPNGGLKVTHDFQPAFTATITF